MFNYLRYRTTNFIELELSLPGSHPNLVLSESEKTQVLLSLKSQRIPLYALCSRGKLLRLQGSAQGPLSPDSRSLEEVLLALRGTAFLSKTQVLRPISQDKRNMKSLTIKIAVNT